jgi:CBS domain-containing protein
MSIENICQTNVVTIRDTATLREVSRVMRVKNITSVVVTRPYEGRRIPVGVITERDLALSLGSTIRPQELPVHQIMRVDPVTVRTTDTAADVVHVMLRNGVKRLPVVDLDGGLVGIVGSEDLLKILGEQINTSTRDTEVEIMTEKDDAIAYEAMAYI